MQRKDPHPGTARSPATPGTLLSGVASAILIVLFFSPWLTACNMRVSGMELATQRVEGQPSLWWLLGIPLVGVAGVLIALNCLNKPTTVVGRRALYVLLLSFYPFLCVAALYLGIKSPPREGQIDLRPLVQFEFGFWGTALASLAMSAGAVLDKSTARGQPALTAQQPDFGQGAGGQAGPGRAPTPPPTPRPPPVQPGAWLEARSGDWAGQRFDISQTTITIGRHHSCGLHLADKAVSRRHAVIRSGRGRFFVQDQNSAGGTYVNGQPVDACELKPGDVIRIGETEFEFHIL